MVLAGILLIRAAQAPDRLTRASTLLVRDRTNKRKVLPYWQESGLRRMIKTKRD